MGGQTQFYLVMLLLSSFTRLSGFFSGYNPLNGRRATLPGAAGVPGQFPMQREIGRGSRKVLSARKIQLTLEHHGGLGASTL